MQKIVFLCFFSSIVLANPSGHKIINGNVELKTENNILRIIPSDKSVIHWEDFSINKNEITHFIQNSKNSVVLNRVVGNKLSEIYGRLEANGKIYLINPQGILIGETGVIDTNGFVGSTLDLLDKDFIRGEQELFKGTLKNSIENLGTITAKDGSIYLVGYEIKNKGSIRAKRGTAGLASVNEVLLQPLENNKLYSA